MKKVQLHGLQVFFILLLVPGVALAHESANDPGFMSGLTHPILGFDHLLAMISVGILSAQMGGRAIWTVPATFVAVMLLGGVMGIQGINIITVELGIAVSVLALGIALAVGKRFSPIMAMVFVGVFAIFHGHAHGTEMPNLAEPFLYALGFVAGTAGIHVAGVLIGLISKKTRGGAQFLRYIGAAIAGIGFHLIIM